MAEIQPMEQFLIKKLVAIPPISVGGVTIDRSEERRVGKECVP